MSNTGPKHLKNCLLSKAKSVLPVIPVNNWNLGRQDTSKEMTETCPIFIPGEKKNCFSYNRHFIFLFNTIGMTAQATDDKRRWDTRPF